MEQCEFRSHLSGLDIIDKESQSCTWVPIWSQDKLGYPEIKGLIRWADNLWFMKQSFHLLSKMMDKWWTGRIPTSVPILNVYDLMVI